jgi:hypothetical protein
MKVKNENLFKAHLVRAEEKIVAGHGLLSVAWYNLEGMDKWEYKVEFWNRHAPVNVNIKLVEVDLEGRYIYMNPFSVPRVHDTGEIMYADDLLFACPLTKSGQYMMELDPLTLAQRYVNKHMRPIKYWRYQTDEYVRVVK